jgi:O-antigen/teichoic acid export membrane protein
MTDQPGGAGDAAGSSPTTSAASRRDVATLARGAALNLVGIVVNAVFAFAFGVIVARSLGAQGSGTFFVATAAFTILQVVAQFGADIGAIRTIARYKALDRVGDIRTVVRVGLVPVLVQGTLLAVLLYAVAGELASVLIRGSNAQIETYLRILAPFLPLAAGTAVVLAAARGLGAMLPSVAVDRIGRSSVRLLFGLAALALGAGGVVLLLIWTVPIAAAFVAGAAWLLILVSRTERTSEGPGEAPSSVRDVAREFWSFSAVRGVAALFRVGILWFDVLLVGALGSARDAGIYSAATRIVNAGSFALQAVLLVIGPQVSGLLATDERERTQAIYQISSAWLTTISLPIYLTTAFFAPTLLGVFGEEFRDGAPALVILSAAMLLDMVTGPVATILVMAGKNSWNLANVAVTLAVNVALNAVLIPRYGITGAAVAWAASIVVQNALPLAQIWRAFGLHPFSPALLAAVAGPVSCFGLVGAAVVVALGQTAAAMVVYGVVGSLCFLGFLHRFRVTLKLDELVASLRRRTI